MKAKTLHDLILGAVLVAAAVELFILPVLKVIIGHPVAVWLQR